MTSIVSKWCSGTEDQWGTLNLCIFHPWLHRIQLSILLRESSLIKGIWVYFELTLNTANSFSKRFHELPYNVPEHGIGIWVSKTLHPLRR